MNQLKRLKEVLGKSGFSIQKFCEYVLKKPYRTFYDQVKNDRIPSSDIKIILKETGRTFEEIFLYEEDE